MKFKNIVFEIKRSSTVLIFIRIFGMVLLFSIMVLMYLTITNQLPKNEYGSIQKISYLLSALVILISALMASTMMEKHYEEEKEIKLREKQENELKNILLLKYQVRMVKYKTIELKGYISDIKKNVKKLKIVNHKELQKNLEVLSNGWFRAESKITWIYFLNCNKIKFKKHSQCIYL